MENTLDRQVAREQRAVERGKARFARNLEDARKDQRGEDTEAGVYLIRRTVFPVSEAIAKRIAEAKAGKTGLQNVAVKLIGAIDPELLAFLTMRALVAGAAVFGQRSVSAVAQDIAGRLDTELRMAAFEQQKPGLYATVMNRLKENGATPPHVKRVITYTSNKYGIDWKGWSVSERIQMGAFLIDVAITTTGLVEIVPLVVSKNRVSPTIRATPDLIKWLQDRNAKLALLRPVLPPMVCPPKPWVSIRGGGYRSSAILKQPIVKRVQKEHAAALQAADLSIVYRGLNAIQDTAWRVNERVYTVAERLWENDMRVAGLPPKDLKAFIDDTKPAKPDDIATNVEARKVWKLAARAAYQNEVIARSHSVLTGAIMEAAKEGLNERLYFPHNLDFRGRCYALPQPLNPQGNDLCRGLLTFAEGKPLGTQKAAGWLAIHGANCAGVDKVSHEARIDWVYANQERILSCAADPLGDLWWADQDSPWSFLAFCFEWAGVVAEGLDYVSSLPIALDGSCNGLQHYSAMLRDPVGGASVNLVPSDTPRDVYGDVAEVAKAKLRDIAASPTDAEKGPTAWEAQSWLDFGIDRKTTKRQVMVLPYGGTRTSCVNYTKEAVDEKIRGGAENPFGTELPRASAKLAGVIWSSIGDVVIAAREAMDWLRTVAKVASEHEVALQWTTPSGFVVRQAYKSTRERRIRTRLQGQFVALVNREETPKLDRARQQTGIPPNFVHSLDASAMMLTIDLAMHNGVRQFAMIHDSYGTLAADTDMLSACLREAFVDMYIDHDVLRELRDEVAAALPNDEARAKLPEPPKMGSLDLAKVLESSFFFT